MVHNALFIYQALSVAKSCWEGPNGWKFWGALPWRELGNDRKNQFNSCKSIIAKILFHNGRASSPALYAGPRIEHCYHSDFAFILLYITTTSQFQHAVIMDLGTPDNSVVSHVFVVPPKNQTRFKVRNKLVELLPNGMCVGGGGLEPDLPVFARYKWSICVDRIVDACIWSYKFCSSYFIPMHTGLHSLYLSPRLDIINHPSAFPKQSLLRACICSLHIHDHDYAVHPEYQPQHSEIHQAARREYYLNQGP